MIDISVNNLVKAYEVNKNILDGISFEINAGERVGLLGKNGAGKTTLFRILTEEIDYDEGDVVIPVEKKIGLISQIPHYPARYTVEGVLKTAFTALYEMKAEMEELEIKMQEDSSPALLRRYGELSSAYESAGGYETDVELFKVCNGLGIPAAMRSQMFESLSGGEKTRVNLARLILEDTDILLLDEPTNHLDMSAVEWLESFLQKFRGTVLTISHDRYFLDQVADRIMEIVDGRAEFYGGNYSFYVIEKQRRYDEQLKKYEQEQSEVKRLSEASARLKAWGTGNKMLMRKAFAIDRRIERTLQTRRPDRDKAMKNRFSTREFRADEAMIIADLSKSFDGRTLFEDINLLVEGGDRIALVGDNGTGKSTLVRIIMGLDAPDGGAVRLGPSVKAAYLPQIIKFDNPNLSLLDTLIYSLDVSHQTARNRLGAFKFQGEDVFKLVSQLSGGEQSRLRLCMLMNEDVNFLILDEPTNHLDIPSREWIEEALADYEGVLLFVSHDRYFIQRFANRIWALEDKKITDFDGGFDAYRDFKERITQPVRQQKARQERKPAAAARSVKVLEKELARLELEINKNDKLMAELAVQIEESATDYVRLTELYAKQEQIESEGELLYTQWLDVQQELEEREG